MYRWAAAAGVSPQPDRQGSVIDATDPSTGLDNLQKRLLA